MILPDPPPALLTHKKRTGLMAVGNVLMKVRVQTAAAIADFNAFVTARPGRGLQRKWARACAAIRRRGEKWLVLDVQWDLAGPVLGARLHDDLQAIVVEARLRAEWLRGAV